MSGAATKASRIEELERQVHHLQHQAASSESSQGIPVTARLDGLLGAYLDSHGWLLASSAWKQ